MGLFIDIEKKLASFKLQMEFSCEEGIIAVLGASGSGKSMLLNCIAGLVKPDKGKIVLDGIEYFNSDKKINLSPQNRKTGYLFQNYAMFPHLTIEENISFGLGSLGKEDQKRLATDLLERFHLSGMGQRYPSQISGGQQQRVALARAMAVEPRILLLDEPFSALDTYLKAQMMKEMHEALNKFGGTAIFVTHNIEEAYRLSDSILILNNGRVEAFESKEALFEHPTSQEIAKISGCKNIVSAIRNSQNELQIKDWGIGLEVDKTIETEEGFLGIRANNISLAGQANKVNNFPVWIADESEGPFRTTLYLKIGSPPSQLDDFHLQWEMSRGERNKIRKLPMPLEIHIDPKNAFFMTR